MEKHVVSYKNMKISVITIAFNAYKEIEKTIQSVVTQQYDNYEYIIVDGASTDGTVDIIKKYYKSISKWISEPDSGIYNAMNKAINMASGEYCIFMNAGDMFANQLVLKQASLFLDDDFDVLTGCEISTKDGKVIDYVQPIEKVTKEHFFVTSISHQASFIKRSLLLRYPYDETLKLVSDWKFWLQTIVFGNCTYRPMDIDVCIFNHDGLTFSLNNIGKVEREKVIKEFYNEKDINYLSQKYNSYIYKLKQKIIRRIWNRQSFDLFKRKLKTIYSYINVLGIIGIPIAFLNSIKKKRCYLIVQKTISKYLKRNYSQFIQDTILEQKQIIEKGKDPIWVCWWQGEKMMPLVPKICIKKIRENLNKNQCLIIIDKTNYNKYINIPQYIIDNVNKGNISITNFSNILRFGLLSKYGGLWIDATCYTTSIIPDISSIEFYSSKKYSDDDYSYISKYRWASYLIGGKQRLIFTNMFILFLEYCKRESLFVDYLLLDYFLNLIYNESSICKESIDKLGISEPNILDLQKQMNEQYNKDKFPNGIFHKLSWKIKFNPYIEGTTQKTFWGEIIENI